MAVIVVGVDHSEGAKAALRFALEKASCAGRRCASHTTRPARWSSCARSASSSAMDVRLKRAYQRPARSDGYRVLIDRLWPRGVSKEAAQLDEWARELAPNGG